MNALAILRHMLGPPPCWAQLIARDRHGNRVTLPTRIDTDEQRTILARAHLSGDPFDWPWMREDGTGSMLEGCIAVGMFHLRKRDPEPMCGVVSLDIDGSNHGGSDDGAHAAMTSALDILVDHDPDIQQAVITSPSMSGHGHHVHILLEREAPAAFCAWLARLLAEEASARSGYALERIEPRPSSAQGRLGTALALPWRGSIGQVVHQRPASERSIATLMGHWREWHERVESRKAMARLRARHMLARLTDGDRIDRCQRYLAALPIAVEGHGGHRATVRACMTGADFGLSEDEFWPLLCEWNARCMPPWKDTHLRQQLVSAIRSRRSPVGCKLSP